MLTRRQLRARATTLALPTCAVKRRTITPAACNPGETFATEPGLISPFLPPSRDAGVTALVVLPWPDRWEAQEREVAISLSLWESLLLPLRCLRQLLQLYARQAYPAVRVLELPNEGITGGHADKHTIQLRVAHLAIGSASSTWETDGTGSHPDTGYHPAALKRLHDDEEG
jgi:hypothetical protein